MTTKSNEDRMRELLAERQSLSDVEGFLAIAKSYLLEIEHTTLLQELESAMAWIQAKSEEATSEYVRLLPRETPKERNRRAARRKMVLELLDQHPAGIVLEDLQDKLPYLLPERVTSTVFELIDHTGEAVEEFRNGKRFILRTRE